MSTRNEHGYPVPDKLAQAHAYAEAARERLAAAPCDCRACGGKQPGGSAKDTGALGADG